jgi:hypothetical protein
MMLFYPGNTCSSRFRNAVLPECSGQRTLFQSIFLLYRHQHPKFRYGDAKYAVTCVRVMNPRIYAQYARQKKTGLNDFHNFLWISAISEVPGSRDPRVRVFASTATSIPLWRYARSGPLAAAGAGAARQARGVLVPTINRQKQRGDVIAEPERQRGRANMTGRHRHVPNSSRRSPPASHASHDYAVLAPLSDRLRAYHGSRHNPDTVLSSITEESRHAARPRSRVPGPDRTTLFPDFSTCNRPIPADFWHAPRAVPADQGQKPPPLKSSDRFFGECDRKSVPGRAIGGHFSP